MTLSKNTTDIHAVLNRCAISRPFVICASAEPNSHVAWRIIEAWAMLKSPLRRVWQLVVIGHGSASSMLLRERATNLGLTDALRVPHHLGAAEMGAMIKAAQVLLYQGEPATAGAMLLSAWSAETAVMVADPNVDHLLLGGAAIGVDSSDAAAISRGLTRVLKDAFLRQELVQRGRMALAQLGGAGLRASPRLPKSSGVPLDLVSGGFTAPPAAPPPTRIPSPRV